MNSTDIYCNAWYMNVIGELFSLDVQIDGLPSGYLT